MLTVLRYARDSEPLSARTLATGRQCLALARQRYDAEFAIVPSFAPQGVMLPLIRCRDGLGVYDLTDDLSPDTAQIEGLLRSWCGRRIFVVVIHYCGYKIDTDRIAELCHDFRAVLVEDCAHALVGPASAPEHADLWFYSFNKFLPVTDGATINSRRLDIDLGLNGAEPPPALRVEALAAYNSHLECNRRVAQAADQKIAAAWGERSALEYNRYYEMVGDELEPHSMTERSAALAANCSKVTLGMFRGANARMLREKLPPSMLWRDDEPSMCFPIRCNGKRDEIAAALIDHGVQAGMFFDKWRGLQCEFAQDHLLLPLGTGVTDGEVNLMANVLSEFK